MSDYQRRYIPGATYFFTVVTAKRQPIFQSHAAVKLLAEIVEETREARPFERVGGVVLHDHLHAMWTLPPGDTDYSTRWSAIKGNFTRRWLQQGGHEEPTTAAQNNKRERGVWQPRFMEHTIRDEDDFDHHLNYIHWNPVKHGYVTRPIDWPYSSLHRYVREGIFREDWGCVPDARYTKGVDTDLFD